jgi:hypothetical protein
MAHIKDLGRRLELVSMDPYFHDISISLYRRPGADGAPEFLVHSYSGREGTGGRIDRVAATMAILGGMEPSANDRHALRFPCGGEHLLACKRIFLEACKRDPGAPVEAPALSIYDKKAELTLKAEAMGEGHYRLVADGEATGAERRIAVLARGLQKLAGLRSVADSQNRIAFDCGHPHDALVGLLLGRALNVRAAIREVEAAATRGILAAPGALDSGPVSF